MALQITELPVPPARTDPVNFSARADAFFLALPTFRTEANALATEAETDAATAETKASEASVSAAAASVSASAAAASFDAFDDRYLGSKSSDPTLDNDGQALITGALYFNAVANELRVYNATSWQTASIVGGTVSSLNVTGNLGVGTTDTLGIRQRILGSSLGGGRPILRLDSSDGVGGGGRTTYVSFAGLSNDSGISTEFGFIGAAKRNATQGDTQGYLTFAVNNGTNLIEAFRVLYNKNFLIDTTTDTGEKLQVNGVIKGTSFTGAGTGLTGTASNLTSGSATVLQTPRTIGGVSFNGSANINLPGVNTDGNQNTSGNAATATQLQVARNINGVPFSGTSNVQVTTAGAGITVSGAEVSHADTSSQSSLTNTGRTVIQSIDLDSFGHMIGAGIFTIPLSLGESQTYQVLTGSRALNTNYTNSTGRAILAIVRIASGGSDFLNFTVDGVVVDTVETGTSGINLTVQAIVPAGSVYSASASNPLTNWTELR